MLIDNKPDRLLCSDILQIDEVAEKVREIVTDDHFAAEQKKLMLKKLSLGFARPVEI